MHDGYVQRCEAEGRGLLSAWLVPLSHRYYAGARHGLGIAKLPEYVEQRTALAFPPVARASQNDVSLFLGQIECLYGACIRQSINDIGIPEFYFGVVLRASAAPVALVYWPIQEFGTTAPVCDCIVLFGAGRALRLQNIHATRFTP